MKSQEQRMDKERTYDELAEEHRHMEAELQQYRKYLEQIVSQATIDLQGKNTALQNEIGERKQAEEHLQDSKKQLENSRNQLEAANSRLEAAIFKSNQMAADAEIRNYHLEHEIERRKRTEALLRESENKYRSIIENIEDGYCEMDASWNITFFNDSLCKIIGLSPIDLQGLNWSAILPPEEADAVFKTFSTVYVSDKAQAGYHCKVIRNDESLKHIELSLTPMTNPSGQKTGLRSIIRDADQRKQYEEKLIFLAYHDALTGLYNRKAFYERLEQALNRGIRYKSEFALLYIDIDRFKLVNDTHGHQAGDALLKEITERLKKCLRITDFLSRIGGDEFTVIMDNPHQLTPETAAARIIDAISRPYQLENKTVDFITASVGISVFPKDATGADGLISKADAAMYQAKEHRNGFSNGSDAAPGNKDTSP
jgi:diguanylate cyclase (GGDEF)-like protein/PAS domain S-box-containing protein